MGLFASLRPTPPTAKAPPLAQRGILRVTGPESDRNLTAGHPIFSILTLVKTHGSEHNTYPATGKVLVLKTRRGHHNTMRPI